MREVGGGVDGEVVPLNDLLCQCSVSMELHLEPEKTEPIPHTMGPGLSQTLMVSLSCTDAQTHTHLHSTVCKYLDTDTLFCCFGCVIQHIQF